MTVEETGHQTSCVRSPLIQGGLARYTETARFPLRNAALAAVAWALFCALNCAAQEGYIFKGEICLGSGGGATTWENGLAQEQCLAGRGKRGARYLLSSVENQTLYQLDGRRISKDFIGSHVVVVGALDKAAGTIPVYDIFRALPPKVTQAKSIYVDCDACPRDMAAAWLAAFEGLADWGRFDVVPDPKKADLILLLSANPYLGDYLTRDGPDKRPVRSTSPTWTWSTRPAARAFGTVRGSGEPGLSAERQRI